MSVFETIGHIQVRILRTWPTEHLVEYLAKAQKEKKQAERAIEWLKFLIEEKKEGKKP